MCVETEGTNGVARLMEGLPVDDQLKMISALASEQSTVMYAGKGCSVLDSGSARHLNAGTVVTHSDDCIALKGFNDTVPSAWT